MKKSIYEMQKARLERMESETIKMIKKWEQLFNLGNIQIKDHDRLVKNWFDEMFALAFQVWIYEIQESINNYKASEKQYLIDFKSTQQDYIDVINDTPINKKIPLHLVDLRNRLSNEFAVKNYSLLVSIAKRVPQHLIDKKRFPINPIVIGK